METLREFILDEMHKRKMSGREFADFVGVANSTIVRATDFRSDPQAVSIEFLAKLAKATKVDLCTLVAFVFPELTRTNAQAAVIGALASQLPTDKQETLLGMLRGWGVIVPQNGTQ